jgi:cyclic-di-GMP phosphodiesterase TipF (flagellum assembly factor)
MSRVIVTVAVTAFIVVIALAIALTVGRVAGIDANGTIVIGIGLLVVLHIIQSAWQRLRDQAELRRRMDDLDRLEDGLTRPIQQLASRVTAVEQVAAGRPVAEMEHLLNEVDVLGTLVKHLAESVAEVDQRVDAMAGATADALPAINGTAAATAPAIAAEAAERVRAAIEAGRIEIHLQPIVTLPQRRTRFYEALTRLRDENGTLIMPAEYLPIAGREGLMPKIDNLVLFRSVQLLRSLMARQKETGLFLNLSGDSLADGEFFAEFSSFMQANKALSESLIFELSQSAVQAFGPLEQESIGAITGMGFRLSMDRVSDLKADFKRLAERGFRFVKIAAPTLLRRTGRGAPDIAPTDMSDMLARYGIDLIADHIETEAEVIDLLDYDIRLGQGNLFAPPRPVRAEAIARARPETAATAPAR